MQLAATHKQTKGGTECQSASSTLAIPGLPTTISAEAFRKSLLAGLAKDGHADVVKDLAAAFPTGEPDEDGELVRVGLPQHAVRSQPCRHALTPCSYGPLPGPPWQLHRAHMWKHVRARL